MFHSQSLLTGVAAEMRKKQDNLQIAQSWLTTILYKAIKTKTDLKFALAIYQTAIDGCGPDVLNLPVPQAIRHQERGPKVSVDDLKVGDTTLDFYNRKIKQFDEWRQQAVASEDSGTTEYFYSTQMDLLQQVANFLTERGAKTAKQLGHRIGI